MRELSFILSGRDFKQRNEVVKPVFSKDPWGVCVVN